MAFGNWNIGGCNCAACGGGNCQPCPINLTTIHDGTVALTCSTVAGSTQNWQVWISPCRNAGGAGARDLVWCSGSCTVFAVIYWLNLNITCSGTGSANVSQIHKYVVPVTPGTCADAMLLDIFGTRALADDIMTLNSSSCNPMHIVLTENSPPFVTHTFTP